MSVGASTPSAADRPSRPSPLLLVLAPIPGVGHWAIRRGGRGLIAFATFALGLNLVLMSGLMQPVAPFSPVWGWALAGAAVAFSLIDVGRLILGRPGRD